MSVSITLIISGFPYAYYIICIVFKKYTYRSIFVKKCF